MSFFMPLPSALRFNMKERAAAKNYALKEYERQGRLAIWIDGSVRNLKERRGTPAVTSFAWKVVHDDGVVDWADMFVKNEKRETSAREAELFGVGYCLHNIVRHIFENDPRTRAGVHTIVVYTDCLDAVEKIAQQPGGSRVRYWEWAEWPVAEIYVEIEKLAEQYGLTVEINWVPGHEGVEGNEWANFIAHKANGYKPHELRWTDRVACEWIEKEWRARNERDEARKRDQEFERELVAGLP
ncbi:putative reverse transcriptase [Diplodia seriata]|uniref:Putative reverse transcriptase n=1 Tax=Diplodia seriata TaxID=420778 RepID=A0A0G2EB89_9PEZI|nr:putative reverse transcriptase [Diplodia seriata]